MRESGTRRCVKAVRPAEAVAFAADPDAALRDLEEPVLLDEWQAVPGVLAAVERAVDVDARPGRYVLTGSARADLDAQTWPGTGRVLRLAMYPLTVAEAIALNTAGTVEMQTLLAAAGINRKTALAYEHLLANLMVLDVVPAWTSNRLKRLTRSPKRYIVEPALLAGVLRLDTSAVMREGDLLGRVLDTFVAAQLRSELTVAESRPRMYHLRQEQGRHEIDLLVELGAERVLAFGDRFLAGVVLHTGPRVFPLGERIIAAPICTLWS